MPRRRQFIAALAALAAVSLAPRALRAQALSVVKQGPFAGASGHAASGSGAIVAKGAQHFVSLGRDFVFDGGPDAKVALGRGGYDPATLLGPLRANAGAQSYALPAGIDPAAYDEIWVWCEQYDVPLAVATLR